MFWNPPSSSRFQRAVVLRGIAISFCLVVAGVPTTGWSAPPSAATTESPATNDEPTVDGVTARLKKVEETKDLDPSLRSTLTETYGRILQQLKLADEAKARAKAFSQAIERAPAQLQELKSESAAGPAAAEAEASITAGTTRAEAQKKLSQAQAKLAEAQKTLADLQNEPKLRSERRLEIPKLQDAIRKQLDEFEKQLAVKPNAEESTEAVLVTHWLLVARKRALEQELLTNQEELAAYEATADLLAAQRDQAVVREAQAEEAVQRWQAAVNERRRNEASRQALDAERVKTHAHPAIKRLAGENTELAARRQATADLIEQAGAQSERLETRLQNLEQQYAKVTDRAERAGLNETIGLLLRKYREDLPNVREHRRNVAARQAEIASLSLHLLELEDERAELADLDAVVKQNASHIDDAVNPIEMPIIAEEMRELFQTKRDYLDSLIADTGSYLDKLLALETQERQYIKKAEEFQQFSDENVLWIRSAARPRFSDLPALVDACGWLASGDNWQDVLQAVRDDLHAAPWFYAGLVCSCLLLGTAQHFWRRRLRECGREAQQGTATSFKPTAEALLLTVLLSAGWPALLWLCGWRLDEIGDTGEFPQAIGLAIQGIALLWLALELARQMCRGQGLGEAHFDWSHGSVRVVRRTLRWLLAGGLPAAFVVLVMESQATESWKATLGRAAFVLAQGLTAWCAWQIWHAPSGLFSELVSHESDARWKRFERFWQFATVGAPIVLAAIALAGYYYTAVQLAGWMYCTVFLLFGVVVLHAAMLRWMLLAYRELAIQRARERRAAEAAATAAAGTDGKPPLADAGIPEPAVSLSDVNIQTRSLLRMGLLATLLIGTWLIWSGVLPALGIFARIELWPNPLALIEAGATEVPVEGRLTLADAILALIIAMVTFAAARNIPGLLEITVLRQLSMDAGLRYAVTAVSKYAITVVGMIAAFGRLGVGWTQVQWLVAAVSVGLGFGMQEIFANFVSGLILLFERPIRIGDVVSVGEVTGKVSRIRIRATTITDWDLRELVVPNKEFITGRVMNWTLTDTTARMTIHVGVAYRSDPDLVRLILLRIAREHPLVLKSPAPHALLDDLGESSINFTLRVYLTNLDASLQVRHELHASILAELRAAGIELPFPQRDLNLRSVAPEILQSEVLVAAPHFTANGIKG